MYRNVLLISIVMCLVSSTSADTPIYRDVFNGSPTDDILGRAPDVAAGDYASNVWISAAATSGWFDDGHKESVGHSSAMLPFTPEQGKIYRLSSDLDITEGGTYMVFGFYDGTKTNPMGVSYGAFELRLNQVTAFTGYARKGSISITGQHDSVRYTVVLDCTDTDSANWTMSHYMDGVLVDGAENRTAAKGNYADITYVGYGTKETAIGTFNNFELVEVGDDNAHSPNPLNEQDFVARDVILSWMPGSTATVHDVYFGTSFDDVKEADTIDLRDVLVRQNLAANSYDPGRLEFGQTYYWRVDDVNVPTAEVIKGNVWSFTTEPKTYPIANVSATASSVSSISPDMVAANLVNGSGLTDGLHDNNPSNMWQSDENASLPATLSFEFDRVYKLQTMNVWNSNTAQETAFGLGAKDVTIEIADSNEGPWTKLADVALSKASGMSGIAPTDMVDMQGVMASNVRVTIHSNQNGFVPYVGLAEVQFLYLPVVARELQPADGTFLNDAKVTLSWRNGREAAQHQVYIDVIDNLELVEASDASTLEATLDAIGSFGSYTVSNLNLSSTYVWKIAEVNEAEIPATNDSPIQSFTTPDFLVVDDMESYNGSENLPWMTWADGYEVDGNGSEVGADPMFNDYGPATGLGRGQSLPIWFDNTTAPISEATNAFEEPRNWSLSGITTLSLFLYEGDNNMGGSLYLKINDIQVALVDASTYPAGYHPGWVRYNVELTGLDVSSVRSLAIGVEGTGAQGVIYVDDIRLYAVAPELPPILTSIGPLIEAESGIITPPFRIMTDLPDRYGGQYIMTSNGSGDSNDDPPAQDAGWAVYSINIPADGDYQIAFLGTEMNNGDAFWVNIPGMIVNDDTLDDSGWVNSDGMFGADQVFVWDWVRETSGTNTDPVVFTLAAGQHELQVALQNDDAALDAIAIFAVSE